MQIESHSATRCFDQAVVAASKLGRLEEVLHIMATMRRLHMRVGRVAHGSTIACIARTRGPDVRPPSSSAPILPT